jgi:hypothetical protein
MRERIGIMAKKQASKSADRQGDAVVFRYVGKGWVPGIPARDLTWEEAEAIGVDVIRNVLDPHTGAMMYEEVKRDA